MKLGIVVVKRLRWFLNINYIVFTGSLFYWYQQDSNHWFRYEPKDDFNDEYTHQHNVVSVNWHSVVAWAAFIICMSEGTFPTSARRRLKHDRSLRALDHALETPWAGYMLSE